VDVCDAIIPVAAMPKVLLEQDVTVFPYAALLASNAVDRSGLIELEYDKEAKTSVSLGDKWQFCKMLRAANYAVTMRSTLTFGS
jgi:hypothetical protein